MEPQSRTEHYGLSSEELVKDLRVVLRTLEAISYEHYKSRQPAFLKSRCLRILYKILRGLGD